MSNNEWESTPILYNHIRGQVGMSILPFSNLPLHDAVLNRIELSWQEKLCRIHLAAFVEPGLSAVAHQLEFYGVTRFVLSHSESWGPSASILNGSEVDGVYQLQMQSGDNIEVKASGFSFVAL